MASASHIRPAATGTSTPAPTAALTPAFAAAPRFAAPALTDPEAALQWHLGKLGGLADVWADYTGKGVHVGVYDSGIEYTHPDLAANYDASRHVVIDGKTYDGDYRPSAEPHGTPVAGIIAAARNGVGTVGVAYDAKLTSINIFDPYSGENNDPGIFINARGLVYQALQQATRYDVANHSYGPSGTSYGTSNSRLDPATVAFKQSDAMRIAAEQGRGGLGTISVKSGGNHGLDGQGDPVSTSRHVVSVAAYREVDGNASSYSGRGAQLLVSAPSDDRAIYGGTGIVATDLMGRWGYNLRNDPGGNVDYTDIFGGTSAAAPMVTGVVALMLDANQGLGWRDVKNILAASSVAPRGLDAGQSSVVAGNDTVRLNESQFKLAGRDADWNGGSMHYSTDYGYGAVDARSAVRMAEVWSLFDAAKTSANERRIATDTLPVNLISTGSLPFEDAGRHTGFIADPQRFSFRVGDKIDLEHVDLTLTYSASFEGRGGLNYLSFTSTQLKLTAPDGTEAFVDTIDAQSGSGDVTNNYTFGFSNFRGVNSAGTWTFEFLQATGSVTVEVGSLQFTGYGSTATADDVHTYTDEFFAMAAFDGAAGRQTLSDANGGIDWINAAAVTADVRLSLIEGTRTTFDNTTAFPIARGSRVEHAVTGDGDDRLTGNALDNKLFGMRGDDRLNGGAGNDALYGGQGNDVFVFDTAGVSGRDRILDWSAGDRIATNKMLRGADKNGVLTVGTNALLLLDGNARGDTAELVQRGGATLQTLGKQDGYWWYGFLSEGSDDFLDGRVTELALGQTGYTAGDVTLRAPDADLAAPAVHDMQATAYFLYDTMGGAMASGVQTYA